MTALSRFYFLFVLVVAAVYFPGCASMARRVDPQDAQRVLNEAQRFQSAHVQNLGPTASERKPLRPGQWVATLTRSKQDPHDVSLQVTKVVDVRGDTVTFETEMYAASNGAKRSAIQQTVRNFPIKGRVAYRSDDAATMLRDIEVEEIRVMDEEGEVATLPRLPFGMGRAGADLMKSNVAMDEIRTEPCASSRFKASKCHLVPFEASFLWMTERGTTYAHSAVPIQGFLRSESQNNEIEVIGFGDKGAQRLIR